LYRFVYNIHKFAMHATWSMSHHSVNESIFINQSHDAPCICFAGRENVVDWDFTLNELVPGEPLTAPVQALRCDGHQHAGH